MVDDDTVDITYPTLEAGQKLHVAINHDEMSVATNEQRHRLWLSSGQQPLRKKGNGRSVHVSDFILETTGRLALTSSQLEQQQLLPPAERLSVTDARRIIFPGKNGDAWWDSAQLLSQIKDAIPIFEHLHPGAVGVWIFDCSSAHEAFADDALNVNNMNIKPGGKQRKIRSTIIPLSNPPPNPGNPDTRGQIQPLVFPDDHQDTELCGKAKGLRAVLMERTSVWDALREAAGGDERKIKNVCEVCKASQVEKDRLAHVAGAACADGDVGINDGIPDFPGSGSNLCCVTRALSQQQDFLDEKPVIQRYIEEQGHICLFLPKFHCELDPIEMYWGWAKHSGSSCILLGYISYTSYQNTGLYQIASLQQPNGLCPRSWIPLTQTCCGSFSARPGVIWMHMSE
jgi:hypothetical protein